MRRRKTPGIQRAGTEGQPDELRDSLWSKTRGLVGAGWSRQEGAELDTGGPWNGMEEVIESKSEGQKAQPSQWQEAQEKGFGPIGKERGRDETGRKN